MHELTISDVAIARHDISGLDEWAEVQEDMIERFELKANGAELNRENKK